MRDYKRLPEVGGKNPPRSPRKQGEGACPLPVGGLRREGGYIEHMADADSLKEAR